jgi:multiple sugar transport system substrate-binding protein
MKKILCLLAVLAIVLTGCGKQETTAKTDADSDVKTAAKQTTIKFVVREDVSAMKWFNYVVNAYQKKYPNRKVKLMPISGSESDFYTKMTLSLKTDSSVDVVYTDGFLLKSYVNSGYVSAMPEIKTWKDWKEFYPSIRKSVTFNNEPYGVPLNTDTRGLYYNQKLFKKAGIKLPWEPKNWQDIIVAAKTLKEKLPEVNPFAMATAATGEGTTMQTFQMLLYGTDDTMFKDGKWVVESKGFLNSLKFIDTMFKNKLMPRLGICINPQYATIVITQLAPADKVGIILDGGWICSWWLQNSPETFDNYKFIPMPTEFGQAPGYTTMAGGWVLAISEKSKQKPEAMDFIKFALSKDNMLKYSQIVSNLASREDTATDEEYPEHLKVPGTLMQYAHFRPTEDNYSQISVRIQQAVESVAVGQATPEQAMKKYADDIIRVVGKDNVIEEGVK